uniref:Beta-defensin n=1 Tax=Oryzias sinensis TaxID=183150 RepID=A0A8C7ZLQ2_9TELE
MEHGVLGKLSVSFHAKLANKVFATLSFICATKYILGDHRFGPCLPRPCVNVFLGNTLNPTLLLVVTAAENEAASFPWSCSSLNGQCRNVCLPHEMFFGPLGCGKGFMCCVSHFL